MEEEEDAPAEGAPAWMATFSDLATLLLTFFVLLLSFAEIDVTEFKVMLGSIKEAFGVQTVNPGPFQASSTSPIEFMDFPTSLRTPLNDMEATLMRPLRRYIGENNMEDSVEVLVTERGVVVRMRDGVLFESGSDVVKPAGHGILDQIHQVVSAFPDGLSVEGHTDDRPIHTRRFPSNWELSAARATAVLRYMQRDGPLPVAQLQVVGLAATQPVEANDTDEHRTVNRRVEFVFKRAEPDRRARVAPVHSFARPDAGSPEEPRALGDAGAHDAGVVGADTGHAVGEQGEPRLTGGTAAAAQDQAP